MKPDMLICPLCEEGHLLVRTKEKTDSINGVEFKYISTSSVCDHCESTIATADMIDANAEAHTKAREAVEDQIDAAFDAERKQAGLLTSHEIRQRRTRLKLTQIAASQLFGGGIRAFSKYETCQTMQSEAMDKLIRLASEVPEAMEWLYKNANVQRKTKTMSRCVIYPARTPKQQQNDLATDFKNEIMGYASFSASGVHKYLKIDNIDSFVESHNKIEQNEKQGREKFSLLGNVKNNLHSLLYC